MGAEPSVTCTRCGLNVPRSTTTYSNSGDLLCKNCGDSAAFQQQIARAEASASQGHGGGVVGLARTVAAAVEVERAGGVGDLRAINPGVFQMMHHAGAESFTCRCAKVFPIDQGAYSRGGRVLCPPCLAADTTPAPAAPNNAMRIVGAVVGLAIAALFVCWRLGLFG